ncbi:MAG: IS1 family transposase [Polyangiaceae bacterium]|nr:IS1 family transposase [Polyangiaceae bacterium]
MANVLPHARRVEVVAHLVEGTSIRATSRLTGVSQPAILSLLVRMGEGCDRLHDRLVRDVDVREVQCDEIWSYVQKKQARVTPEDPAEWGDAYTFVAMARACKLVLAYRVGKRDDVTTRAFISDLRGRLVTVPQISTDGFPPYPVAIGASFQGVVDYTVIHKNYRSGARPDGPPSDHRYEPPRDPFITKIPMFGAPDMERASTSHIERQNLTMRMHIRRMTRLCNGFSRKLANHHAAVALHFAFYNFCRIHESLRVTPAMEARVVDRAWTVDELVAAALAEPAGAPPRAKPLRLPEPPPGADAAPSRELPGGRGFLRLVKGGPTVPPTVPPVPPATGKSSTKTRPWRQMDLFGPEDDA